MNPTRHPSNNALFGAPSGWDHDALPCDALPITRAEVDGQASLISFWRPTAEELEALFCGGLVVLHVLGHGHPVVALGVE